MDIDKIKYIIDFSKKTGIHYALEQEDIEILEHILAERKVDKKKIEELEEKNKEILNSKIGIDLSYDDYIPKQKVKEGLEDIEDYFDRLNGPDEDMEYIRNIKKELLKDK